MSTVLCAVALFPTAASAASVARTATVGVSEKPPGGSFIDDTGSVYEGAVEAIARAGITRGCNPPANTRFCPDEPVTRAEMAAFLHRAFPTRLRVTHTSFSDNDGSVFEADISWLAATGMTSGCNPPANTRFCPDRPVTREQMASFLTRILDLPGASSPVTEARFFTDVAAGPHAGDIAALAQAGITRGCNPPDNDRFCPNDPVSRGEMAIFLMRALGISEVEIPEVTHQVTIEGREAWNARPADTSKLVRHSIDTVTIHHDGSGGSTFGPSRIAGYQSWHMDHHGWGDIAYHFIIGRDGVAYAGRDPAYRGDSATEYDLDGHLLIVLEGHFDRYRPTDAQLRSLELMMAWASGRFGVPVEEMRGHRHRASSTSCPGRFLVASIEDGSLAAAASELLLDGGVSASLR